MALNPSSQYTHVDPMLRLESNILLFIMVYPRSLALRETVTIGALMEIGRGIMGCGFMTGPLLELPNILLQLGFKTVMYKSIQRLACHFIIMGPIRAIIDGSIMVFLVWFRLEFRLLLIKVFNSHFTFRLKKAIIFERLPMFRLIVLQFPPALVMAKFHFSPPYCSQIIQALQESFMKRLQSKLISFLFSNFMAF